MNLFKDLKVRNKNLELVALAFFVDMVAFFIIMAIDSAKVGDIWMIIPGALSVFTMVIGTLSLFRLRHVNKKFMLTFVFYLVGSIVFVVGFFPIPFADIVSMVGMFSTMMAAFTIAEALMERLKEASGPKAQLLQHYASMVEKLLAIEEVVWIATLIFEYVLVSHAPQTTSILIQFDDLVYLSIIVVIFMYVFACTLVDENIEN